MLLLQNAYLEIALQIDNATTESTSGTFQSFEGNIIAW